VGRSGGEVRRREKMFIILELNLLRGQAEMTMP
jgi:hypothetical protein